MDTNLALQIARRRWPIIALAIFVAVGTVFLSTPAKPPPVKKFWSAQHELVGTEDSASTGRIGTISFSQVPGFITSGVVPARVAARLGVDPQSLAGQVQATADPGTQTVLITSQQTDPKLAVTLVNAFADEIIGYLTEKLEERNSKIEKFNGDRLIDLAGKVEQYEQQKKKKPDDAIVQARLDAAIRAYSNQFERSSEIAGSQGELGLTTRSAATIATEQQTGSFFSTPKSRAGRMPLFALFGLIGGCFLAWLVDRLDGKIRDRRRAEQAFGAQVIAEIPNLKRHERGTDLMVTPDNQGHIAELFRSLRSSVVFLASNGDPTHSGALGIVLVTSASPSEAKSTTCANLAAAFAESGRSVIVVNADFRRPKVSDFFLETRPIPHIALDQMHRVDPEELLADTAYPTLRVLDLSRVKAPAGELARTTVRLAQQLRHRVDIVLIDSPPILVTAEALEFIPEADVALMSARAGRSHGAAASRAADLVRFGGVQHVAVVMHGIDQSAKSYGQYNGYYGRDPRPKRRDADQQRPTASGDSSRAGLEDLDRLPVGDDTPAESTMPAPTLDPLMDR